MNRFRKMLNRRKARGTRDERGVAMLMALITMLILSILAGELVYQSGVYSSVVFRQRDLLRAQLLARSGLRLALLQLKASKKAKAMAKNMGLGDNTDIVDRIWQTPMILPPPDVPGLSGADSGALAEFRKSLSLDGSVTINIAGSNDRMSINQLVWMDAGGKLKGAAGTAAAGSATGGDVIPGTSTPGATTGSGAMTDEQKKERMKQIRTSFTEIFDELLNKKRNDDTKFRDKYPNLQGATLVGNLAAWMDPDTKEDGENRQKEEYYSSLSEPYSLKNAPVTTENEYPMIKGLDDEIAKLIADNFTVQATSSLNVNKASLQLIGSMIPELRGEDLERIGKRRSDPTMGGQFKTADDFWKYLTELSVPEEARKNFEKKGIAILDAETSYRAVITAESGLASRTWMADIGGLPPQDPKATSTATAVSGQVTTPQTGEAAAQGTSTSTNTSTSANSADADALNVLYLRAD